MGTDLQALCLNQFDDISAASESVATTRINLYDIDTAGLDEPFITFDIPLILTCTDGCHNCCPQLGIRLKVMGWQGLLNPFEPIGFKIPETLNGCRDIPNAMVPRRVNDQLKFVSDDITHATNHLNVTLAVETEYRLWSHPPSPFDNAVVLLSQPPKFVERPVQVFHIENE
jgi:hypothetical protein